MVRAVKLREPTDRLRPWSCVECRQACPTLVRFDAVIPLPDDAPGDETELSFDLCPTCLRIALMTTMGPKPPDLPSARRDAWPVKVGDRVRHPSGLVARVLSIGAKEAWVSLEPVPVNQPGEQFWMLSRLTVVA